MSRRESEIPKPIDLVHRFARSLDDEHYEATFDCLATNCRYDSPQGELLGPAAIVGSYQANGDNAAQKFDSVGYEHEVTELDDGWFEITFFDHLTKGKSQFTFRCLQRVQISEDKIVRITHHEIPGLREQLNDFLNDKSG